MTPAGSRAPGTLAPRALLLLAVVIWGWTFVATRILVAEIGPVEVFALRLAIGLPFLGGVLLWQRVRLRFTRADVRPLLLGGAILTLHFLIQISGIVTTTATNTAWIVAVSPLALALLSFFFLGERMGWAGVSGIAVATLGLVLLVSRGHVARLAWLENTGDWLVLASAFTWALYTVTTRDLSRRSNPLAVTFALLLVAALFTGVLFAATADLARVRALSPRAIAALLYLGIPGLALGQWFWQEGVARLGAARAGLYLYLEPLATLALAVPLLGEPFGPFVALGGALVLTGVCLGQRDRPGSPEAATWAITFPAHGTTPRHAAVTGQSNSAGVTRGVLARLAGAGLLTALSDGLFSSVLSVAFYHSTVTRLWQGVASVLLGRAALEGGTPTALIGLVMHVGVAFTWSTVFLVLVRPLPWVGRLLATRWGTVKVAFLYGPFIWMAMSLAVIPLFTHRLPAIGLRWWIQWVGHVPFVALPMVASLARPGVRAEA